MNRHGYHNEMPLPTYEEVVGTSNHNIGFKDDILLRTRTTNGPNQSDGESARDDMGVPDGEDTSTPSRSWFRCTQRCKKYLLSTVTIIITPLLFLLVFMQLKPCVPCKRVNEDTQHVATKLHDCKAEITDMSGRYDKLFNDLQTFKIMRDELLLKQQDADTVMKNLRYEYNISARQINIFHNLKTRYQEEIMKYKDLLKKMQDTSNDNAASTKTTADSTVESIILKFQDLSLKNDPNLGDFKTEQYATYTDEQDLTSASPQI